MGTQDISQKGDESCVMLRDYSRRRVVNDMFPRRASAGGNKLYFDRAGWGTMLWGMPALGTARGTGLELG